MDEFTLIERIVWDEFIQAKSWEQYISEYAGYKIDFRKWFNVATGALVVIGSSSWSTWKLIEYNWITPIILLLVGVSQILTSSIPYIIVDNETLKLLAKLRGLYIEYSNQLEHLVLKIYNESIDQSEIEKQYFSLRETVYPIEELKDSLNIRELKKLSKKVEKRVKSMVNARYKRKN